MKCSICALVALAVAGCAAPLRPVTPPPANPPPGSAEDLSAAIAADAKRSDHESDSKVRALLAAAANRDAQACIAREPQAAACLYGRAVALGLDARAHPARAGELLSAMLASLTSAEAADPDYDQAGPARVRALVLIRAPGWPLGPGDADAGLLAARRAVSLRPQYPPNLLALAEALSKTGQPDAARDSYERARAAAQAMPPSADRDEWLRQVDEALRRK
jgi:tetratricopeptide (TPR) repeat protein